MDTSPMIDPDRLQKRLRDWFNLRLKEKDEERGELTAFGKAVGWTVSQVREYLKGKRHLSFDQVILAMRRFNLNIHQIIDDEPLPTADYETRVLLSAWKKLEVGHPVRRAVLVALSESAQLPRPFRRTQKPQPSESPRTEKTPTDQEIDDKKHGGRGGGR